MNITPDPALEAADVMPPLNELEAQLKRLGMEIISYRAGQVVQYEHQTPRGYVVLVRGALRLRCEDGCTASNQRYDAKIGPWVFPNPGALEQPLHCSLQAETNVTLWFFSRFICQPCSLVTRFLEGLSQPGNPLFANWSLHVSAT